MKSTLKTGYQELQKRDHHHGEEDRRSEGIAGDILGTPTPKLQGNAEQRLAIIIASWPR